MVACDGYPDTLSYRGGTTRSNFWGGYLVDIQYIIIHKLSAIAVPIYFIISGYYLYRKSDYSPSNYRKNVKKRFATLVVPYLIWNLIAVIWIWIKQSISGDSTLAGFTDSLVALVRFAGRNGPANIPLWYVRDLCFFVLISPILYKLAKSWWRLAVLVVLAALWVAEIGTRFTYGGFAGILFFYVGLYLTANKVDIAGFFKTMQKQYYSIVITYIAFTFCCTAWRDCLPNIVQCINLIMGILTFLMVITKYADKLMRTEQCSLSRHSFFIFCMHGLFTSTVVGVLNRSTIHCSALSYPIIALLIISGSIALLCLTSIIISKHFPKTYNLLSGGR